ncbi:hypothetical protein BFW01_g2739 [Lasiodiplodia theobromae]|nr:hypothetical protein BFW01_g2739 [Lasiodiplodia theobromae]
MDQPDKPITPMPTADMHGMTTNMRNVSLNEAPASLHDDYDISGNGHGSHHNHQLPLPSLPPNLTLHQFTLPIRNAVPSDNGGKNQLTSTLPTPALTAAAHNEELTTIADNDTTSMEVQSTASSDNGTDKDPAPDDSSYLHAPIFGRRVRIDGEGAWRVQAEEVARLLVSAESKYEVVKCMKELPRTLNGTIPAAFRLELRELGIICSRHGWLIRFVHRQQAPGVPNVVAGKVVHAMRFLKSPMQVLGSQESRAEKQQKKENVMKEKKATRARRRHKMKVRRARENQEVRETREQEMIKLEYDVV